MHPHQLPFHPRGTYSAKGKKEKKKQEAATF